MDRITCPKVSVIQRVHCITLRTPLYGHCTHCIIIHTTMNHCLWQTHEQFFREKGRGGGREGGREGGRGLDVLHSED